MLRIGTLTTVFQTSKVRFLAFKAHIVAHSVHGKFLERLSVVVSTLLGESVMLVETFKFGPSDSFFCDFLFKFAMDVDLGLNLKVLFTHYGLLAVWTIEVPKVDTRTIVASLNSSHQTLLMETMITLSHDDRLGFAEFNGTNRARSIINFSIVFQNALFGKFSVSPSNGIFFVS